MIESLTTSVGAAVDGLDGPAVLAAYVRSLVSYMRDHPTHTRMIIEGMTADADITDTPNAPSRRDSVAAMIRAARTTDEPEAQRLAVIVNGAIVSEGLTDPGFDTMAAAERLIELVLVVG